MTPNLRRMQMLVFTKSPKANRARHCPRLSDRLMIPHRLRRTRQ
jgi:hypothetical protein